MNQNQNRFYPLLVALRVNFLLINVMSFLYMLIDLVVNIYKYGECEGISHYFTYFLTDIIERPERGINYIVKKSLFYTPFSIFSAILLVEQAFKIYLYLKRKRHSNLKVFFRSIFNLNDQNEVIYSEHDLNYVIKILKINKNVVESDRKYSSTASAVNPSMLTQKINVYKYTKVVVKKRPSKLKSLIKKYIYDWNEEFRFSSRFINSIMVSVVTLYYFFISAGFLIGTEFVIFVDYLDDLITESGLKEYLSRFKEIKISLIFIVLAPLFISFLISLLQVFFLVKETRGFLNELYKGKCDFVKSYKNASKESIASSSFSFGGYV